MKEKRKKRSSAARSASRKRVALTAVEMGARQREISVSEFFTKNRHLLGFDNPRKALLTCVKEAVDNSLDACEDAGILPEIIVRIEIVAEGNVVPSPSQATRFRLTVTDNGPGIVPEQIPRIFAKLLYGSKFHRLRMSRGQQGIGISAAGMYGQLTTGKPVRITSRTSERKPAHYFEIQIDTRKNEPIIGKKGEVEWEYSRGTQVSIELEGRYQRGRASVDEYLELTSIANPHASFIYHGPDGEATYYPRTFAELPHPPREIKPHPYGIELGLLLKMLHDTKSRWLSGFLCSDFSRVSQRTATQICEAAGIAPRAQPRRIARDQAENLYRAIQATKIMSPPTDCISPIGEKAILAGLYKQIRGDFYTAATRPPSVYRGNPFVIEAGLAYGTGNGDSSGERKKRALAEGEKHESDDFETARVIRYANRVPLVYQQSACSAYKSVLETSWKNYGLSQSRGSLPQAPLVIFIHMASVWVPFTSESKEAIADYDEIRKEMRLALQECGRRLSSYLRKREHAKSEHKRRNIFSLYIEEVAEACSRLKGGKLDSDKLKRQLMKIAVSKTGGEKTDDLLKKKDKVPDDLVHSIVMTPTGPQGDVPKMQGELI